MEINFESNTIVIFGKKAKLDAVMSKFVQLNGDQLSHFIKNRAIKVPRKLHLLALMKVLNRKVKELNSNSLSLDYFQRLQYYKDFTEEQYAILFDKIASDDPEAFLEYRYNFVRLLFLNNVAFDFNDGEINYIRNISKEKMEKSIKYIRLIDLACVDQEDTFDGVLVSDAKKNLPITAPAHEIRTIGKKYGVSVPERLNKEQLLEYIQDYLGKKMAKKDFDALSKMSLNQISEFCKKLNIEMSSQLNKQELVTYLFYLIDKKKLEKSTIKELIIPDEFKPLEFTVDIDSVNPFGNADPVKVIHYEGEDKEIEKEKIVLIEDKLENDVEVKEVNFNIEFDNLGHGEKPNPIENIKEVPEYLPVLSDDKFDFVGWFKDKELTMPVEVKVELKENLVLFAKWEEKVIEAPAPVVEEVKPLEPIEEPVEEPKEEIQEELKEELAKEESEKDFSATKNDLYGSKKVANAGKNKAKLIVLLSFLAILIGVLAYILIILFI